MGVNLKRKRGSLAMEVVMVMVALVLLINTNSCGASFVLKSNVTSYRQCITTGAMDGCLIADDLDLDFDFFMDTHVVRILDETDQKKGQNPPAVVTPNSLNENRAACFKKHKNEPYKCDANQRNSSGGCRHLYEKGCPK